MGGETQLLTAIGALVSATIAAIAIWHAKRARSEVSWPDQIANLPDFFRNEYTERAFVPPVEVSSTHKLHTLKDARLLLHQGLLSQETNRIDQVLGEFHRNTLEIGTWQNRFAYELSLGLQSVGAMVLAGAIPLGWVLAVNGTQIIEDWIYCSRLVQERIRASNRINAKNLTGPNHVGYHRRHGEWLAYAAAIYVSQNWEGDYIDHLLRQMGDLKFIREREREIRQLESGIIPRSTNVRVEKVLGNTTPSVFSRWTFQSVRTDRFPRY